VTAPVTAATRLLVLLGDPVSHSRSPLLQNAAMRALGLDGVYVALRCGPAEVPGLLRGLALAGGGGNVTVPHKEAAYAAVDQCTAAAEATGAVNTFWSIDGEVWGDNTDVAGFSAAVRMLLGRSISGGRALVIGAGGGARAAVHALASHGAERIVIVNRTAERARDLARRFASARSRIDVVTSTEQLDGEPFDLAVNATSLGLVAGDPLPLDPEHAPPIDACLDLVYGPRGTTPWVRAMGAAGVTAADGSEMLLQQGAAAFRRWWGVDPPRRAMRAALRAKK
jgi:shikimate dehydrogenase